MGEEGRGLSAESSFPPQFLDVINSAFMINLHKSLNRYARVMPNRSQKDFFPERSGRLMVRKGNNLILVTRFNGSQFYINAELIQTIEATPDTVISMVNNSKIVVKETPQVLIERIIEYRQKTLGAISKLTSGE